MTGDLSDLELLEIEIETLWPMDDRGRITTGPDLVIASAASGSAAAVGSAVSNELAAELQASVRQSRSATFGARHRRCWSTAVGYSRSSSDRSS